jgi:hypothetical protein
MARAEQIRANVLATPQEIARRFFLLGWNVDRRERPGAIENGELTGVPAVRLDAVAGASGNQCRRDDVTRDVARLKKSLQLEAAGARLVATPHAPAAPNRSTKRPIVGKSGESSCIDGLRWPGRRTAATTEAAC